MGMSNDLWVHMRMHRMTLHQFIVHILSSSCNSYAVYESTTDLETSAPKLLRIIPKFEHLKAQLLKTKNTTQSQHSYSIFLNRVALDAKHNLLARVFTKHRTKDPTKPCNSPSFYHVLSIYLTIYLSIYLSIYTYIYIYFLYIIYIYVHIQIIYKFSLYTPSHLASTSALTSARLQLIPPGLYPAADGRCRAAARAQDMLGWAKELPFITGRIERLTSEAWRKLEISWDGTDGIWWNWTYCILLDTFKNTHGQHLNIARVSQNGSVPNTFKRSPNCETWRDMFSNPGSSSTSIY
jgi:hypothetical protein